MEIAIQRFGDVDVMNLVIDFESALLATCTMTGMALARVRISSPRK